MLLQVVIWSTCTEIDQYPDVISTTVDSLLAPLFIPHVYNWWGWSPAESYSSSPTHRTHGDGGHSIVSISMGIVCFVTTVVPNTNNAMRTDDSRNKHESYANSMHAREN